ncbi:hypothetical protein FDECE_8890 [Fusarium decemcellulare]|nr:hypothetical protein FDECE_8890 [Fusarium decemcellulare]
MERHDTSFADDSTGNSGNSSTTRGWPEPGKDLCDPEFESLIEEYKETQRRQNEIELRLWELHWRRLRERESPPQLYHPSRDTQAISAMGASIVKAELDPLSRGSARQNRQERPASSRKENGNDDKKQEEKQARHIWKVFERENGGRQL